MEEQDSAVAAALAAVRLSGEVARAGFITRRDLIGQIATDRFAPELASESATELAAMERELAGAGAVAGDLVWAEIPLRANSSPIAPGRLRVEVWSVFVFGVAGAGAPRQAWRTSALEMLLVDGRWLVDGWASQDGPTPALAPSMMVSDLPSLETVLAWRHAGGRW